MNCQLSRNILTLAFHYSDHTKISNIFHTFLVSNLYKSLILLVRCSIFIKTSVRTFHDTILLIFLIALYYLKILSQYLILVLVANIVIKFTRKIHVSYLQILYFFLNDIQRLKTLLHVYTWCIIPSRFYHSLKSSFICPK